MFDGWDAGRGEPEWLPPAPPAPVAPAPVAPGWWERLGSIAAAICAAIWLCGITLLLLVVVVDVLARFLDQ
jgi:hypothetical protein